MRVKRTKWDNVQNTTSWDILKIHSMKSKFYAQKQKYYIHHQWWIVYFVRNTTEIWNNHWLCLSIVHLYVFEWKWIIKNYVQNSNTYTTCILWDSNSLWMKTLYENGSYGLNFQYYSSQPCQWQNDVLVISSS